jgi:hypothetical protein
MKLSITIELQSTDQLNALTNAVDMTCDMEGDREKDGEAAGFGPKDKSLLVALRQVRDMLNGKRSA